MIIIMKMNIKIILLIPLLIPYIMSVYNMKQKIMIMKIIKKMIKINYMKQ